MPKKDRYFEEDKHTVRSEWGQVWTVLTSIPSRLFALIARQALQQVVQREVGVSFFLFVGFSVAYGYSPVACHCSELLPWRDNFSFIVIV